ncbi:mitochondrial antiviral-signaling protein [Lampris incognitus]|uniref:mitochondrial antiviral-signaling protein n=1 Tax=Lampris incognitus TaxID=2546036 RepID=UPI0024B56459|nr:mitochondrial antiviral-signaling protein [Lampris incognitus]
MAYARDKLYNGYVRQKMSLIVNTVKVTHVMPYLPCLTSHDREEIEAKRETRGNFNAMQLLLDCLQRRETWPEEFIRALEACEHDTLAAEIRAEYNALRGLSNPNPSPPPSDVVRVHVHPVPPASQPLPPLESADNEQAAASPPPIGSEQALSPPEAPAQAEPTPSPAPQPAEAVFSSEPDLTTPRFSPAVVVPHLPTPPPSPEAPHHQATAAPPSHREIPGDGEVSSVGSDMSPEPLPAVDQYETAASVQTTTTWEDGASQSPASDWIDPAEATRSSSTFLTPEKLPVQDTAPPLHNVAADALRREENSESVITQVSGYSQQPEATGSTTPLLAGIDSPTPSLSHEDDVCLSKPGLLLSIQQNNATPTISVPAEEPYSGDSDRLEVSDSPSASLLHNEPEENYYESNCLSSLGRQEVLVNVVHVAEGPSIQNQTGQSPSMLWDAVHASNGLPAHNRDTQSQTGVESVPSTSPQKTEEAPGKEAHLPEEQQAQILNGEATSVLTKEPASVLPENCHPAESGVVELAPDQGQQNPREGLSRFILSPNTKYFLTAAGVSTCALLVAWKLKN